MEINEENIEEFACFVNMGKFFLENQMDERLIDIFKNEIIFEIGKNIFLNKPIIEELLKKYGFQFVKKEIYLEKCEIFYIFEHKENLVRIILSRKNNKLMIQNKSKKSKTKSFGMYFQNQITEDNFIQIFNEIMYEISNEKK